MIKHLVHSGFVEPSTGCKDKGFAIKSNASLSIVFTGDKKPKILTCKFTRTTCDWPTASVKVFINGHLLGKIKSTEEGTFKTDFELGRFRYKDTIEITLKIFPTGFFKMATSFLAAVKKQKYKNLVRDTLLIRQMSLDGDNIFCYDEIERFNISLSVENPVRIFGFFNQCFGLAEASRRTKLALSTTDIDLKLTQVPFKGKHSGSDTSLSADKNKIRSNFSEVRLFHFNGDHLSNVVASWGANVLKCKYSIGFWHWEQSNFPNDFLSWFNGIDEIWVPSNFVFHAVAPKSPVPTQIVPLALEPETLNPPQPCRAKFSIPETKVVFMITFDFYSHIERKNPNSGIKAFVKLISDKKYNNKAHLVIKTSNHHADPDGYKTLIENLDCLESSDFTIIRETLGRQEMLELLNSCDALLSLHRSEGFGLHLAEAMAMRKVVIATNWSGNTDFMNKENSFPINYKLVKMRKKIGSYKTGIMWAEPDINHAAGEMKKIVSNLHCDSIYKLRSNASESVTSMHDPQKIGKIIEERLEIIQYHSFSSNKKTQL